MIVAFMNALDGENRNGRTIPITKSNTASVRLDHGGSRFSTASRHFRSRARNLLIPPPSSPHRADRAGAGP